MKYKRNGFTLIEMIFVLGIISVIILLAAPIQTSVLKTQEEEKFIQTFKEDVLFIQNQASRYYRGVLSIKLFSDRYVITNHDPDGLYATRYFPKGWRPQNSRPPDIKFKYNGNISSPRSIIFRSDKEKIVFTFPLGKGRFHVGKE